MGLLRHSSDVSVETLARDVRLSPIDNQLGFPNDRYDARLEERDAEYPERLLFMLNKGVKGSEAFIPGERMGFVDYGRSFDDSEDEAARTAPIARVTLLKKAGIIAVERLTTDVHASEILPDVIREFNLGNEPTIERFCKQAIARAVLKTANGDR
jgi:hypothetical protein